MQYKGSCAIIKKWYQEILTLLEPGHKRGGIQTQRMNSGRERKGKDIAVQKENGKRKEDAKL